MFLTLIPLLLAISATARGDDVQLTVKTDRGSVLGHYAPNNPTVREFLGISYGAPPVGNLRWMPAVKPQAWGRTLEAKDFGPSCYHTTFGVNLGDSPLVGNIPKPPSESEDCLSINVWTPTRSWIRAQGGAAVMLWVYGGAFTIGSSPTPYHNGANFVRDQQDVIIVSFNYRLNIFGFPGASVFGKQANPGLHDVRSAVEWVRDNIAQFGGNPEKITLFGESAGGAATDSYLFSNQGDPIISGAIMESGTSIIAQGARSDTQWDILSALIGCKNMNTSAQVQLLCMRNAPAARIRDIVVSRNLRFMPVADNTTMQSNNDAWLRSGRFARVPIIVGSNDQEIPTNGSVVGPLMTLVMFTCPAARRARFSAQYVPTWQYRYFGNWPTGTNPDAVGPGAYHTAEISQVFGTYNATTATDAQKQSSAWAAFAKDPKDGLVKYGQWPVFNPNGRTLVRLAQNNVPGANFVNPTQYEVGCTF